MIDTLSLATEGLSCSDNINTLALATKGQICDFIIIDDIVITRRPTRPTSIGRGGISFPIDSAIQIFVTKGISKTTLK